MSSTKGFDVFISHASEDKEVFVRPLAEMLHSLGMSVWYDEFALKAGEPLPLDRQRNSGLTVWFGRDQLCVHKKELAGIRVARFDYT